MEGSRERVIIPVDDVNQITLNAVRVAREISGTLTAVHVADDLEEAAAVEERWKRAAPDIPMQVIESPYRSFTEPLLAYVESVAAAAREVPGQKVVVILPTFAPGHWWERVLHNRDVLRLKPFLKANGAVRVIECPYRHDRPTLASSHSGPGGALGSPGKASSVLPRSILDDDIERRKQ